MESSGPEKQPVRVTILSRPYTLLATGDPREVEEVAASVDELMLSIAAKAPTPIPPASPSWHASTSPTSCASCNRRWRNCVSARTRRAGEYAGHARKADYLVEELSA